MSSSLGGHTLNDVGPPLAVAVAVLLTPLVLKKLYEALTQYWLSEITTCCGRNGGHCLCGYNGPCQAASAGHVVVFVAKEIVTMDPTWPSAKVVAVQDGRIVAVGQDVKELQPWLARPGVTHSVDETFRDLVLVPGFIEQHNHPLIGGTALSLPCISWKEMPTPFGETLPGVRTRQEAVQRMRSSGSKLAPGEDLIVWGWDSVAMGGHLSKTDLDQVDTTRCVVVWDASLHFGYCNSFTLAKLKLTAAKHGKVNGVDLDHEGKLNGSFKGIKAMYCLMPLFSRTMHPARALASMHYITELGRQNGITTMCELMHGSVSLPFETALYKHFYNHESTPMRCVMVSSAEKVQASCFGSIWWATSWLKRLESSSTEKLIFSNAVKFFTDDAFVGLTMQMSYPGYVDGHKGIWNCGQPGAKYAAEMLPWWKAGCRIHVHSNGDAAQDATAEALATLQTAWPRFDHRFCLEHYGMSSMHIHRRLRNLGASVAVNAYYLYYRGDLNVASLGKDRAHAAARLRTIVDAGLPLALHTDTPVAPPRPLEEMWIATNRLSDSGEVMCPSECVTAYQAMKMKTVDAAYVHGLDGLLGSIEAGKLADFTVLAANPLTVPSTALRGIKVWGTVVGGKKYKCEALEDRVPRPPMGLLGPLLWLFGATATSGFKRGFWMRMAALAGCRGPKA